MILEKLHEQKLFNRWWLRVSVERGGVMDYQKHFNSNPHICGGETVISGTRVTLKTVLASLAEGDTIEQIIADYPSLSEEDIRAAIAFAAATAKEDIPVKGWIAAL